MTDQDWKAHEAERRRIAAEALTSQAPEAYVARSAKSDVLQLDTTQLEQIRANGRALRVSIEQGEQ